MCVTLATLCSQYTNTVKFHKTTQTHSKTPQEDKKQPRKQSLEIGVVRKKLHMVKKLWQFATITLITPKSRLYQISQSTQNYPQKASLTFERHKSLFTNTRDNQKQNKMIVDLCWQLSSKLGSPKTSIVGQFKVTPYANILTN